MTFLNGAMITGALAFAIPLLIHLMYRSRPREVSWGAMHLLSSVVVKNRRRMQWTRWLLLLVRCLIPLIMAFTLARPVLLGVRASQADVAQSLVLVIDDSRSMAARDTDGIERMELLRQAAQKILRPLSRRDEVAIVLTSQIGKVVSVADVDAAEEQIRSVQPRSGPFALDQAIEAGLDVCERFSHPVQSVVVLSDFQRHTTEADVLESSGAFRKRMRRDSGSEDNIQSVPGMAEGKVGESATEMDLNLERIAARLQGLANRPEIGLISLGNASETLANVSIDSMVMASPAAMKGRVTNFVAELRNSSDEPASGVPIRWSVNGDTKVAQPITVPPRASITLGFTAPMPVAGLTEIGVAMQLGDALPDDNRRELGVDVIDSIDVLLIDGSASGKPLEGASDFLSLALQPGELSDTKLNARFDVLRFRPQQVGQSRIAIREPIVVLIDTRLDDALKAKLADHVLSGGSLVIFGGENVNPKEYAEVWGGREGSFRIPAVMGETTEIDADSAPARLGNVSAGYTPWEFFAEKSDQSLGDVVIQRYRQLRTQSSSSSVLLTNVTGEALVVLGGPRELSWRRNREAGNAQGEDTVDRRGNQPVTLGRIMQFAFSPHPRDTNLPLRPAFVPLMQQMLLDLAGNRDDLNVVVGDSLVLRKSEVEGMLDAWTGDPRLHRRPVFDFRVRSPSAHLELIQDVPGSRLANTGRSYVLCDATESGRHEIDLLLSDRPERQATAVAQRNQQVWRIAQMPAIESDLRQTDPDRLRSLVGPLDAKVHENADDWIVKRELGTQGREVWRWMCFLLLGFLVGELFLVRRTG